MNDEQHSLQAVLGSYGLRLCAPAIRQSRGVEEELLWLEWVASRQQVRVPRPVRNQQHDLITAVPTSEGTRLSCLFEWVPGEPARECLTPTVLREIGQAVASLHVMAREAGGPFQASDFRSGYQYGSRLAAAHREWIAARRAEIGEENARLLEGAVAWLLSALARMGEPREKYGLIHADLHFGNFLVQDGQVSVIDFDQLGWGHYGYDLAVLKVELANEVGDCAAQRDNLVAGYQQVAPLPFAEEGEPAGLTVAVHLAFLDWIYNSPNPSVREQMGPRLAGTLASISESVG